MAAKRRSKTASPDHNDTTTIAHSVSKKSKPLQNDVSSKEEEPSGDRFLGNPIPLDEARQRWPHRYDTKRKSGNKDKDDSDEFVLARRHYTQAEVDHVVYNLHDDAHVKAGEGEDNYICKIVEFFEGVDGEPYFTAQWFYRAVDTVIKNASSIDGSRVFYSEIKNDNCLNCLVEKLKIVKVSLNSDLKAYKASIPACDYYYDMHYLLPYSTFVLAPSENEVGSEISSTISTDVDTSASKTYYGEVCEDKPEIALLDLYAGCGAMSTGLCLGAQLASCNLVTRWAVDINKNACESLKLNHPETEVRNETAEDFLQLLKEWEKLCIRFSFINCSDLDKKQEYPFDIEDEDDEDGSEGEDESNDDSESFEVDKVLQICFGDPKEKGERGLYFKIKWKNYGEEYDSWEPIEGLRNCRDAIKDFVTRSFQLKTLPLPGGVDVICGGPPCQGVSGFNRFRDKENPLRDEKNKQLTVYMDIIKFLKPKYVLMENVVDILKFSNGFLGRHAIGRLIEMNYQTRIGMLAAGAYGLPQFRMRVFLWGANPSKKLPQFPLPTHDVIVRGVVPVEFEGNLVAYDEGSVVELEKKLFLGDAISDLPSVKNDEQRDEMEYEEEPKTEFQRMIRLSRDGSASTQLLYDHQPYVMNNDDYQRSCRIPKKKGGCFRDLPGVRVRPDGKVEWDPNVKRVYLDSGKPLVPDYAMSFVNGTSSKPFARLWWDETVPTVVTRPEPHNQAILHPVQDRVLTIRENARLQGFPDYYKLVGPVKERYIQVGNAVAVPVARALGYALGLAFQGNAADEPVFSLPNGFPSISEPNSLASSEEDAA